MRFSSCVGAVLLPVLAVLSAAASACGGAQREPSTPGTEEAAAGVSERAPTRVRKESDDEAVRTIVGEYFALVIRHSPELATRLGIHEFDGALDDRSAEASARELAEIEAMLEAIDARFPDGSFGTASPTSRTDLALVRGELAVRARILEEVRPLERMPTVYTEPLEALFVMAAREYAPAAERAERILERMEKLPEVLEAARDNLKEPPRVWTQVAIERASAASAFFDEERRFLLGALPSEAERVQAATATAKRVYAEYRTFLEREVLPRSNGSFAAGKDLFNFLLKNAYHLTEDDEAVLALGRATMEKTNAQMTELARRIDPKAKGWPEVVKKIKARHPSESELIAAYRREVQRARKFLEEKDVVPFPAGDALDVLPTPVFLRSTIQAAYDQPPPFDTVAKGFFFVTPVEPSWPKSRKEEWLRESNFGDVVNTSVHEAYPGHHLQLSFARLHPSLVRKVVDAAIFAEGWALYAEELMAELGYYTDEERLMQLAWTLVRAARVVIDVGLHTRGMSFDDAVTILTRDVNLEPTLARNEVKRYTMSPTQPLSYLVGREAIFALRERFKAQEKERFSLKRFHEELLPRGTVPPALLAREMFGDARRPGSDEGAKPASPRSGR